MFSKKKSLVFAIIFVILTLFINTNFYAYTDFIKDDTNILTSIQLNKHNEAGNQLASKNYYVFFETDDLNTYSSTYDSLRAEYFEKYNYLNPTDKVILLKYFLDDANYENGCLYYYDDGAGYISSEKIEEMNLLLKKYNKSQEYGDAYEFIYSQITTELAEELDIELTNYEKIDSRYGAVNFFLIPSFAGIAIILTAIFAFRKRF